MDERQLYSPGREIAGAAKILDVFEQGSVRRPSK
jgi:hypothetical protein